MMELLAGATFGFLGSAHCIGMCGPIALALPHANQGRRKFLAGRLLYNTGRVTTYALIGAVVGFFGGNILLPFLQQKLAIIVGGVVFLSGAAPLVVHRLSLTSVLQPVYVRVSTGISLLMQKRSLAALFGLGVLNGLLPCGFVYLALAGAVVSGSVVGGIAFMAGFGAGTIPAMMAVAVSPGFISSKMRTRLSRLLPAVSMAVGVLLIVRGLNLGIPYLSPKFNAQTVEHAKPECCPEE